jgi:crotonobetainyl-CoA:carnitine CoA-transferase CaiB-like acyl-CoA transferase
VVKRLIETYDIVLEQFRPGVMDRLGVGYEALSAVNPRLIYCSLTGYGQNGPLRDRAGHDNNYLSLAGVMSHSGTREQGPVPQGVQVADLGAGSFGSLVGILTAVVHRHETGEGQHVDVSMYDGSMMWNAYAAAHYLVSGDLPAYQNMVLNGGSHYGYYRTKDGRYMSVGSLEPKFWEGLCNTLGRPDLIERLSLPGPEMDEVIAEIRQVFSTKTMAEWTEIFAQVDVCVEPVLNIAEACEHPQAAARDMVVDVPRGERRPQKQVANPLKFSRGKACYTHTGGLLGTDTEGVLREAGYSTDDVQAMRENGLFGEPAD